MEDKLPAHMAALDQLVGLVGVSQRKHLVDVDLHHTGIDQAR